MGTDEEEKSFKSTLERASAQVSVGATYAHYKNTAHIYQVLQLGLWESTGEVCVIYQALYGSHLVFIRPLSNFLAEVSYNGVQTLRFQKC